MENTKGIYKLNFDCGRMGSLEGLFIEEKEYVQALVESGIEVYFGEVLGRHSEVYGPVGKDEITLVSDDPAAIKVITDLKLSSGFNPFEYTAINFASDGIESQGELVIRDLIKELLKNKP